MIMTRLLWEAMIHAWAISPTYLDHATLTAMKLQYVNIPFVPGLDLTLASVPIEAAWVAGASLAVADVAPMEFRDVLSGDQLVIFAPLDSPYAFEIPGGLTGFVVYGTRLVKADGSALYATQLFPNAIPCTTANDGAEIPPISFRFPPSMVR